MEKKAEKNSQALYSVFLFQIPNYSQKVHKQCQQECKLLWKA